MSKRPKSNHDLIIEHSHARVIHASDKPYIIGYSGVMPQFSHELSDAEVLVAHAKQYSRK